MAENWWPDGWPAISLNIQKEETHSVLSQFRRVLEPDGRACSGSRDQVGEAEAQKCGVRKPEPEVRQPAGQNQPGSLNWE